MKEFDIGDREWMDTEHKRREKRYLLRQAVIGWATVILAAISVVAAIAISIHAYLVALH